MSEINENLEVNETVENTPVESVVPEVEGTEETPVIEEPVAVAEEPVAEVVEIVAAEEPVVAEVPVVAEEPVVAEPVVAPKVVLVEAPAAKANEEEFDWDAFEGKKPTAGSTSKQSMTEMYDNTLSILQEKECVDGIVISMNKREVVVNIGYKSDGIVSVNEFRYNPNLKVGDQVEVYVETL